MVATESSAQAPRPQLFVVNILPGHSLASDGNGSYRDGEERVSAIGNYAIALCTDQRTCSTLPEGEPTEPSPRAVLLDLTAPVMGSGAEDRGIVRAAAANFGAFWEQDTSQRTTVNGRELFMIRSVLDMDVGRTIESERVEIRFFVNGIQHILQFGPWTAGQYQSTNQVVFHGEGSKRGTITRTSETQWLVRSGSESIGRLWDNRNPSKPADLGLYRFSYEVRFDRK
jgi:hypothetical protein